jgi:DnaA-homolog protein
MKQIPLPIGPHPEPRFDSFIAAGNEAALAHLQTLAPSAAPVYLWGAAGSGKTHLLRALAAQLREAGGSFGWFDAGVPAPWPERPEWSLVVIDDAHRLDAAQQHAAFALFVEAASQGWRLAAAGDAPPVDLPVREDLRTRLGWGHVFHLHPLEEHQMRAAIRREADRRGIAIGDEVMHYLLTRLPRDLSRQMALLDRLDDYSLAEGRLVTVPLLKRMLAEEPY